MPASYWHNRKGTIMNDPRLMMTTEWHLCNFNEGAEIRYINAAGFSATVPLELGDEGHGTDLGFLKYIVNLHNNALIKPRTADEDKRKSDF